MKRILMSVAVLGVLSTSAFAAHGPAGCGLGSIIFEGKSGLVFNVLAATFNGSSANQTFGMSSGTSNCSVSDSTTVSKVNFIEANKVALQEDIARGEGETLASLANMYGCSATTMGASLKVNFETIFAGEQTAASINDRINNVVADKKACI